MQIMTTAQISDGAKKLRNDYLRAWRRRNPHKQRQYMNVYWQKKYDQKQRQLSLFEDPAPQARQQPQKTADQLSILMPR